MNQDQLVPMTKVFRSPASKRAEFIQSFPEKQNGSEQTIQTILSALFQNKEEDVEGFISKLPSEILFRTLEGVPTLLEQLNLFINAVRKENNRRLGSMDKQPTLPAISAKRAYRGKRITKEVSMDNSKESLLEKQRCEMVEPEVRPEISVTVKYVKTGKVLANGKEKKKFGIELNIDGDIVPVAFGDSDMGILYLATLMAQKNGTSLTRSDFSPLNEESSPGMINRRVIIKERLRVVFYLLGSGKDFDNWFNKITPHKIDIAVGDIKKTLWSALAPKHKEAYYYTMVFNNDRYGIRIDRDHVFFDETIADRLPKV